MINTHIEFFKRVIKLVVDTVFCPSSICVPHFENSKNINFLL